MDTANHGTSPMRRIQFIEIHEQAWFPASLRDAVTDALRFGFNLMQVYDPVVPLLKAALDRPSSQPEGAQTVIDLCSGGGGPWLDLSRKLERRASAETAGKAEEKTAPLLHVLLTDKYPNLRASQNIRAASRDHIIFYTDPVDATDVPKDLKGLRTMFTSFHHFPPDKARAILQNAVNAGEGIAIFEAPRRALSTIALVFAWILLLFGCTPWIRPFRWSRLLFTYLVPIIPAVLLFDGIVSCLRTYRPEELREMVESLTGREYQWETGERSSAIIGAPITYLVGFPKMG
ncbi:MAG: hypothetical protein WAK29_03865 [Terriglobales bacterium]